MVESYTDLLIHIRYKPEGEEGYPAEATLSDGSFFSGRISLNGQALREAEINIAWERYGQLLYEALLAGGTISRAYDLASGLARQQSGGRLRVRLWLDSRASDLQQIRWEVLQHHFKDGLVPLSTTGLTPFSRYTALGIAEPQPIMGRPVRVLVAIANPSDLNSKYELEPVDVEAEVKHLCQALGNLVKSGQVEITLMPGQGGLSPVLQEQLTADGYQVETVRTSLENIIRRLADHHVVHFLGHGAFPKAQRFSSERHAMLYLEKRDGTTEVVRDVEIEEKFRSASKMPHLIFLAACDSAKPGVGQAFVGLAPRLVQAGTPAVVAMQDKISMIKARELTGYFYEQLLLSGVVDQALNSARNLLYGKKTDSWTVPALFMRLRTGRLFVADPVQATLKAMRQHEQFNFFDPAGGLYIPMPIDVVHVIGDQNCANIAYLEQQDSAGIEALRAAKEILTNRTAVPISNRAKDWQDRLEEQEQRRPRLVAFLGGFGSNKSTQMKRLVWQTLDESAAGKANCCLPIYVDLRNYQVVSTTFKEPMEAAVLEALAYFWPDLTAGRLSELPANLELRILFYGTDSLSDRERHEAVNQIRDLMVHYGHYQYVLASREEAIDWDSLSQDVELHLLFLQPLRPTKIRHFLENFDRIMEMKERGPWDGRKVGQDLLAKIYQSQLFDLAATPRFMVELLQQGQRGYFPNSRTEALTLWVDGAIAQFAPGQGMRGRATETIYQLAWDMQVDRFLVLPVGEAFRTMAAVRGTRGFDLESLYGSFLKHDLLAEVGDAALRFIYFPVQAYCCAQALLARPDGNRLLADITSMAGAPDRLSWWEDTLIFVCGLMAAKSEDDALQQLMSRIVYGTNLLEGEQLFLAARCLLECQSMAGELAALQAHVVGALRWRTSSKNEPRFIYRAQATELLSRLGDPETIVDLAGLVYEKARLNLNELADFEYSSVRMAAAIGLKRMGDPQKVSEVLCEINPKLLYLFHEWEQGNTKALIDRFMTTGDTGVQAITALALGDLVAQTSLYDGTLADGNNSSLALKCLVNAFRRGREQLSLPVRWAVADALAMYDPAKIAKGVVKRLRKDLLNRAAAGEDVPLDQAKAMAYLIGLIRSQDAADSEFIKDYCLGKSNNFLLWLTAIQAMGRLGSRDDRQLLEAIATENKLEGHQHPFLEELPLAQRFPKTERRNHIRERAIAMLAEIGDRDSVAVLLEAGVDSDLGRVIYQAASDIYRRVG